MSETDTLHTKLIDIQQRLKVPKDKTNEFGEFKYRKLEDIEDKVKPLLKEHKLTLIFGDEMVEIGGRVYVKATAYLGDGRNIIENSAYAREAEKPRAKTDDAQLTGACSSYARKYAAGGLFLIDNTQDADTDSAEELSKAKQKLFKAFKKAGVTESVSMMASIQQAVGKDSVETPEEADKVIEHLSKNG